MSYYLEFLHFLGNRRNVIILSYYFFHSKYLHKRISNKSYGTRHRHTFYTIALRYTDKGEHLLTRPERIE
jgi:hypothetical protein